MRSDGIVLAVLAGGGGTDRGGDRRMVPVVSTARTRTENTERTEETESADGEGMTRDLRNNTPKKK